jgi:hypothetical protein
MANVGGELCEFCVIPMWLQIHTWSNENFCCGFSGYFVFIEFPRKEGYILITHFVTQDWKVVISLLSCVL